MPGPFERQKGTGEKELEGWTMKRRWQMFMILSVAVVGAARPASATEPCGDFGECKALIEINASDGDIGFHFLMDGDGLTIARLHGPDGKIFQAHAFGPLAQQTMTEMFVESSEPLCWEDPEADPDEEIVTLEEFLESWSAGTYVATGKGEDGERPSGETELTHQLPAAPADLGFDGSVVSWAPGNDLGNCGSMTELADLVAAGVLPTHPEDVEVAAWEIVMEPDVEDGDPAGSLIFSVRVPGGISPTQVTVPADYLASLPDDTPVEIEVGAIGADDNATFSEEGGFCANEVEGCED